MPVKFHDDQYKKTQGGKSRWLLLSCEQCKTELFKYQKDGPGILKRLYLDRIAGVLVGKANLVCKKCQHLLGVPIIYKKENRPAIRLFAGAIEKRILKAHEK